MLGMHHVQGTDRSDGDDDAIDATLGLVRPSKEGLKKFAPSVGRPLITFLEILECARVHR